MFFDGCLVTPPARRENVRHATLLFCAEGVNVQTKPARKKEEWEMAAAAATVAAEAATVAAEAATVAAEKAIPKGTIAPVLEDGSKVSPRDIYMRLCACRDFEIKLQWERAVFLTAFLIACYAGYGSFLLSVHQHGYGSLSSLLVKCIPVVITFVGVVLSLLWIFMAKGSKAWYEHYEQAIAAFARTHASKDVPEYMMAHRLYDMPGIERSAMSNCIFSFKGGAYSVSKIVIAIGLCSLAIWSMLFVLHCCVTILGPISKWGVLDVGHWVKVIALLSLIVVALLLTYFRLAKKIGSDYLGLVESILPKSKNIKMGKTSWTSARGSARDWIKKQKKKTKRYVLIEKDKITIYENTESGVSEKTVALISDCIPKSERASHLFVCE